MDESVIQRTLAQMLNERYPEPWGAWPATTKDGVEYIELVNEKTNRRFIITIQKGM